MFLFQSHKFKGEQGFWPLGQGLEVTENMSNNLIGRRLIDLLVTVRPKLYSMRGACSIIVYCIPYNGNGNTSTSVNRGLGRMIYVITFHSALSCILNFDARQIEDAKV